MANSPFNLNYGHPGQPLYDLETSSWGFERTPGQNGRLRQLGSFKLVVPSSTEADHSTAGGPCGKTNQEVQQSTKTLSRACPEIAPAIDILPNLAQVSAAISSTTEVYDPAIGPLLSFGTFTGGGRYMYPRRIAAIPTGDSGSVLCLLAVTKERLGWGADRSFWIEGPSLANCECGYWADDAAPIQQICFSQAENRSSFLAVRYPTRTVIFRPWQNNVTAFRSQFHRLPPSRLDAHRILALSIEQTGGAPHADVTFNFEYQRQFGVVDQKGFWSVWDIDAGYRESEYKMSCTVTGSLDATPGEFATESGPGLQADGWGRILWIGNVNTVVVCNRRVMRIFDIRGGQTNLLQCPSPILAKSPDWILDVQKHPAHKGHLFVITSRQLLVMAVNPPTDVPEYSNPVKGGRTLVSSFHYRGTDDITLQIYLHASSESETLVFVHSRLNPLITIFRFQFHDQRGGLPYSCSDPLQLDLDRTLFGSVEKPLHIVNLQLDALEYGEDDNVRGTGLGPGYSHSGVRFYRLAIMLSDFSILQSLLVYEPGRSPQHARMSVDLPGWTRITRPHLAVGRSPTNVDHSEFIVAVGLGPTSKPQLLLSHPQRRSTSTNIDMASNVQYWTNTREVDNRLIYQTLVKSAARTEDSNTESESVTSIIQEVSSILDEQLVQEEVPTETLFELSTTSEIGVEDVDEASVQLQRLLDDTERDLPHHLERISLDSILRIGGEDDERATISSLYDTILAHWIGSLPAHVSIPVRQAKEQLARRISAEVILASIRIRMDNSTGPPGTQAEQEPTVHLPILPSRKGMDQPNVGMNSFSQPQPQTTFSWSQPAAQQGLTASQPLPSLAPTGVTATTAEPLPVSPFTRLGQHLQFDKLQPVTPPGIRDVLTQWTPGADPRAYQWDGKILGAEDDYDDEDDDEESRLRNLKARRKKEEQLRKRQRRELEKEQRKAESQPLIGMDRGGVRSSPAPPMFGLGMSSQVMPQFPSSSQIPIVQSQMEPGRHGGRPLMSKKKAKDKRKSGF
ncbi:hypothetical protein BU24DRAFT_455279 [Aaosphaeria arxii CBS 175.79]|uniref:RNA polymerase I-specific transcription initiation factor RRN6-like protein n=1 Tax=Aaosphaeria arxii CBS 175.79 TaxID=1450172 RepID=A0A6A5XB23_9PLEO|nr:uncharacterized protein BU24DRAFT_455279 [Aaosphaeria arxii CBS 175.79]KAF2010141.1 hypothetical protein BU24DRAFT_455279 [Aaosphaeria arxii CBS 175.79]